MSHPTPEQLKRNKKIAAVLLVLCIPGYFAGTWAKDELQIRDCLTMAATHKSGNALADVMIASMDVERMCRHYQRKAKAQAKVQPEGSQAMFNNPSAGSQAMHNIAVAKANAERESKTNH